MKAAPSDSPSPLGQKAEPNPVKVTPTKNTPYAHRSDARSARSKVSRGVADFGHGTAVVTQELNAQLKARERETIEATLRASRGRVSGPGGAAKRLGLPHSTLEFRIKRLGIDKFQFRPKEAA